MRDKGEEVAKNFENLRDGIYGWPLTSLRAYVVVSALSHSSTLFRPVSDPAVKPISLRP